MIAYLRGTLHLKEITGGPADRLVIEVAGVGFELTVSRQTALSVGEAGDELFIHTALSIRENDWTIFGFGTRDERAMFELLQSVSGVGPKLALALVGTLGTQQVAEAVLSSDQKMLSQAPGVGSKVAQRIILELKSKIEDWQNLKGLAPTAQSGDSLKEEARAILEGLGYTATEIHLAFKHAGDGDSIDDVEMLVRQSLKVLGAQGR
jgi:Holliday junction DNA helicase RuvA